MEPRRKDTGAIQLWGGLECTVNRVGDRFLDQFEKSGHRDRPEDLDLVAELGIRTLRYPVLWERTAPDRPTERDWRFADERLGRIRHLGIDPIVGLVHHGSGPHYTSLVDEGFAPGLAEHARAVAERYPWVEAYTPVNEPLTTARFSGMYGHWYPHGTSGETYARALVNEVRATVLSMAAIREVNPQARLVQTEDLGKTHSTEPLRYQADFENERRWITWDLLCGRVDRNHRMWGGLRHDGIAEAELEWFLENPCPPDVLGINHYLTSERFLDHRTERYPAHTHGSNGTDHYADVEAIRVLAFGTDGAAGLMREAWARYGLPLAITECHLGCTREEQARWLKGVWRQANEAHAAGLDVRAVTVWSMFGAHDWCSLLTREEGRYEPGVFDLRAPAPRPTALASVVQSLAKGEATPHETYEDDGWWERPIRLLYPPVVADGSPSPFAHSSVKRSGGRRAPLLIVGTVDALGQAFAARCELRGLDHVLLSRDEMDVACPDSVWRVMETHRPWGVIDTTGARQDCEVGENAVGAGILASVCAEVKARLVLFSSDEVFGGDKAAPYVESDAPSPLSPMGQAKAQLENEVALAMPEAMIVRTGALFGLPGDESFVENVARTLGKGRPFQATSDLLFSPTYAIDLVDATLDLLFDGTEGIVHLANEGEVSPAAFARHVARGLGLDEALVVETSDRPLGRVGPRLRQSALVSERAWIMPTLGDALARYLPDCRLFDGSGLAPRFLA